MDAMSRHSFGRNSRLSNPNVFSDEYSLEPIDTDRIERAPSPASITSSTTPHSTNHHQKATGAVADNENPFADEARVSIDEPHRSSLPQKGMGGFSNNRNSFTSAHNAPFVQRNQSISSRLSMPRAMSPYTGATGPSHPYGMYPQVGVSRSPSAGSTSTIRPQERPLAEMNGPQHPYAMYSQNVVEEGIDDDMVPVGFPGHNPPYQPPAGRRDDELGDIIGPDGHAEPLPPYSRYPTGVVPKPPGAENMTDINSPPEDQHLHSISREAPISETSTRALMSGPSESVNGHGNGNESGNGTGHGNESEGDERGDGTRLPLTGIMAFEEKLKQKGKRTACCGLPVWTFVLIITVLLIGGSIGGVIGGVLGTKRAAEAEREAQQNQSQGPHIVTVTQTPSLDYSTMISTPTNLMTVPTGHYLIPSIMRNCSRMCIDGTSEMTKAWSCMNKPNNFEVYVEGDDHEHSIVFVEDGPTSTFTYGPQPPYLPTPTQSLTMAIDNSDPSMGPALFFYSFFNKLVILPDTTFTSSSVSKRSYVNGDASMISSFLDRKDTAQPGDKPWFCWWNGTMLEFFLYVNQSSTDTSSGSTATTDRDMAASTATGPSSSNSKRSADAADYPRKIKIEERRDHSGATAPYCQQMQVMDNGQVVPLANQIIDVKEREPTPTTTYTNGNAGSQQTYTAQASYVTPCYCLSLTD
ncbi:uncharacterized protein N7477_000218 [Penicillium maclennaniae]|uniref:uncharacterized protein n=1 Tax=Penicillium maclennaniae TaxID=1343394 RepID=UPI002541E3EB|nr:uncharacterized protein N7477_000218 [Penicillium maclennaniae]KAJ5683873.1 hypothetical protein N7477_000218 [Penicillium maclennaniae]